jgi:hydrogenase maturation protease
MMSDTLILGLGNPFRGDDGVGAAVVAALQKRHLPSGVTVEDVGTPGLELLLLWQGYHRVLIVDAAEMGMEPGIWRRFLLEEADLPFDDVSLQGTLHGVGLAESLALARALDILPAEMVIYGVQPARTGWSASLSKAVKAAIPPICNAILDEIGYPIAQSKSASLVLNTT